MTEAPTYWNTTTHTQTGGLNEEQLVSLAEDYASRFKVESLGVYDALKDVWRHQNNTSDFATPSNVKNVACFFLQFH